jgi:hypothetical protein
MPEVVEAFLLKLPPQILLDHLLRVPRLVVLQLLPPLYHLRILLHVVLQVLLLGQGILPLQGTPMTSMVLITFA